MYVRKPGGPARSKKAKNPEAPKVTRASVKRHADGSPKRASAVSEMTTKGRGEEPLFGSEVFRARWERLLARIDRKEFLDKTREE